MQGAITWGEPHMDTEGGQGVSDVPAPAWPESPGFGLA